MPVIIAATDFSQTSENAVNYACKLAAAQNAQVIIIHAFMIPVMFSDIPMPGNIITDAEAGAEDEMNKLVARMTAAHPGQAIEGRVIYGNLVEALEDYADEKNSPWLVVVGNSRAEGTKWPDSSLLDTLRQLAYPVLAIPPAAAYNPVKNICFAFDNKHKADGMALQQVSSYSNQLNAALHVLNIQADENGDGPQEINAEAARQLSAASPQYHFVYGASDIDKGIQDFVAGNDIDWLVMIPRKHSFFEGLFHKSHTKAVAHHSHIPILAVHETGE